MLYDVLLGGVRQIRHQTRSQPRGHLIAGLHLERHKEEVYELGHLRNDSALHRANESMKDKKTARGDLLEVMEHIDCHVDDCFQNLVCDVVSVHPHNTRLKHATPVVKEDFLLLLVEVAQNVRVVNILVHLVIDPLADLAEGFAQVVTVAVLDGQAHAIRKRDHGAAVERVQREQTNEHRLYALREERIEHGLGLLVGRGYLETGLPGLRL